MSVKEKKISKVLIELIIGIIKYLISGIMEAADVGKGQLREI